MTARPKNYLSISRMLSRASRGFLVLALLFATGCGGGSAAPDPNAGTSQPPGQSSATHTGMRFLHASPEGGYLTFTWYGNWLLVGLTYQEATPYYDPIREVMEIHVHESFSGNTLAIFTDTFEKGMNYTAVMTKRTPEDAMETIVLTDDFSPPPAEQFKIRFLNLAPSSANVDVYLVPEGSSFAETAALMQNLGFKSDNTYFPLGAGTYQIVVTEAGTDTILKQSTGFSFPAGSIRTAAIFDTRGGGAPFDLKLFKDKD